MLASLCLQAYISSLLLMFDHGCHFCFKGVSEPKVTDFVCHNIVHQRKMVESIYVIKHRFIKTTLPWEIIENR